MKTINVFAGAVLSCALLVAGSASADCSQCTTKFNECMTAKNDTAVCLMENTDCTNSNLTADCAAAGIKKVDFDVVAATDAANPCRQCTAEYSACIERGVAQAQCLMSDTVCTDLNRTKGCAAATTR